MEVDDSLVETEMHYNNNNKSFSIIPSTAINEIESIYESKKDTDVSSFQLTVNNISSSVNSPENLTNVSDFVEPISSIKSSRPPKLGIDSTFKKVESFSENVLGPLARYFLNRSEPSPRINPSLIVK